ncbi:MAG: response regulator transcription factor [Ilumatobacteraceae bacterium]
MTATEGPGGEAAPQRILVVDDEPTVREVVATYLARDGFEVRQLADGGRVSEAIAHFDPHLVVLDVMLPVRSGFDVLRELRTHSELPVILLTARSDEADRVLGLELGGDDYLVKPFSPRADRPGAQRAAAHHGARERWWWCGTLGRHHDAVRAAHHRPRSREVTVDGSIVSLTAKEFDLLAHLAANPRQVFSRAQLLHDVWDSDPAFQDPATVTVHVGRLRGKIESDPEHPRWIATVFGVGYRFEP